MVHNRFAGVRKHNRVENLPEEERISGALNGEVDHATFDEGLLQDSGVPEAVAGPDGVEVKAVLGQGRGPLQAEHGWGKGGTTEYHRHRSYVGGGDRESKSSQDDQVHSHFSRACGETRGGDRGGGYLCFRASRGTKDGRLEISRRRFCFTVVQLNKWNGHLAKRKKKK